MLLCTLLWSAGDSKAAQGLLAQEAGQNGTSNG